MLPLEYEKAIYKIQCDILGIKYMFATPFTTRSIPMKVGQYDVNWYP